MQIYKLISIFLLLLTLTGCTKTNEKAANNFSPDEVADISVTAQSYQLKVRESTDNQIHVKYTNSEKNTKVSVVLSDAKLIVSQVDTSKNNTLLGGLSSGKTGEINIYIPESYGKVLNISNGNGELELSSLSLSKLEISNVSGYLTAKNIKADSGMFISDSGDIKLNECVINAIDISTTSAYISINDTESSNIKTYSDSGEISINSLVESCNTSVENSSGDITVSYKSAPTNLSFNIATNSNDISCRLQNADYSTNIPSNKKGSIGSGNYSLAISSDRGSISVK